MSYDDRPPNEHALQFSQRGDFDHYQAWLNQFSIPQYNLLPNSPSASFPAGLQSHIPSESPAAITTNAYPTSLPPPQYRMSFPPAAVALNPFMHAGTSTLVDGRNENTQNTVPERYNSAQREGHQHPTVPGYPQQRYATPRSQHQNPQPLLYRNYSSPTSLATIHPTLGPCILVPIGAASQGAPQSSGSWMVANTAGPRHNEYYASRLDRLHRRHGHEDDAHFSSTSLSPSRSPSPYLSTPSSSPTVTSTSGLPRRRRDAHRSRRSLSPPRFRGDGDYVHLRSHSERRSGRQASISTTETCSECRCSRASSSSGPNIGGELEARAQGSREGAAEGQKESTNGCPMLQEQPVEESESLQHSVEVDD
ncbi:hypothetical protein diail_9016 [Diaporthe ilicicola]|nr:hypothetical protein diail_9016 [Diaporthe ilicicola]